MKMSKSEPELADVYAGTEIEHRRENFRDGDMLNCFRALLRRTAVIILNQCSMDENVSIQPHQKPNIKKG